MNLFYRFFLNRMYVQQFVVLLALCMFLGSVSHGSERDRERSIAVRPSKSIKLLKDNPLNTIETDFLKGILCSRRNHLPRRHPQLLR
jgi:hypothetical protein